MATKELKAPRGITAPITDIEGDLTFATSSRNSAYEQFYADLRKLTPEKGKNTMVVPVSEEYSAEVLDNRLNAALNRAFTASLVLPPEGYRFRKRAVLEPGTNNINGYAIILVPGKRASRPRKDKGDKKIVVPALPGT